PRPRLLSRRLIRVREISRSLADLQQVEWPALAGAQTWLQRGQLADRRTQRLDLRPQRLHPLAHARLQLRGKVRGAVAQAGRGLQVAAHGGGERLLAEVGGD